MHDVVPKSMETSTVRLSWVFFLNLLTCESESPPQAFFFPSVRGLRRNLPLQQGLSALGSATFPGNPCWWPPPAGKLQRVHPACVPAQHQGVQTSSSSFLIPGVTGVELSCVPWRRAELWKPEKQQVGGGTAGVVHCSEIIYLLFCVRELMDEQS